MGLFTRKKPGPREIALGHGNVKIAHGVKDGRRFVALLPSEEAGEIGSIAGEAGMYTARPEDTVIWFDAPAAGAVLCQAIIDACTS